MIELNQLEKYIISKKDKIKISSKDIKSCLLYTSDAADES